MPQKKTREVLTRYNSSTGLRTSMETEVWVNQQTGEIKEFQNVEKRYYGAKHFWKMYLIDFLQVLGVFENRQLDVMIHILENTNPASNQFIGRQVDIMDAVGVSKPTVREALKKLVDIGFIAATSVPGVYTVNPDVLAKGSEAKRRGLLISYKEEKSAQTFKSAKRMNALDKNENQLALSFDEEGVAVVDDPLAEEKILGEEKEHEEWFPEPVPRVTQEREEMIASSYEAKRQRETAAKKGKE